VNVSRDIIYASKDKDFARKASERAATYATEMKAFLADR
jgi:hypothetical protein